MPRGPFTDKEIKRFDEITRELAHEDGVEKLLAIPGIWEVVSEHYNNDAYDRIMEEREGDK